MPSSSNHQNNNIASQTVTLPISYFNYLCSREKDCFSSHVMYNFHLFPGIEVKEQAGDTIKLSINGQALPFYYQAPQTQTVIQNALQTLKSISELPADVIGSEAQKDMALSIHKALKACLCLENSESSIPSQKEIAFLSFGIAIRLVLITAFLILFLPLVMPALAIPSALAMVASILFVSCVVQVVAAATIRDIAKLINFVSIRKQAKTACNELDNVLKENKEEIDRLPPTTSDTQEPQAPSSAAAAVVNEASGGKRPESPTRSSSTLYQLQAASANSPVAPSDVEQENTATMVSHP